MKPQISIIILNWNGWKDTIECLESIYQINYPNYQVIVVDNGSEDNSIEKIKNYCSGKAVIKSDFFEYNKKNKPIKIFEYSENELYLFEDEKIQLKNIDAIRKIIIIKNFENKGYTDGNNIGMRFAAEYLDSDYIIILNNDIVVDLDFLNELVTVAQKEPNIGILGPVNLSYDNPKEIQSNGAIVNFWNGGGTPISRGNSISNQRKEPLEVDFVGGATFMIKREVIEKIGVFYSPYFANWEETDYCINAKKSGFKIISVPKSQIWHKVSSSISLNSPNRIYWILRNNIIFMRRNAKFWHWPSFLLFYFLLRVPSFVYYGFRENSVKDSLKLIQMISKAIKEGLTLDTN